MLLSSSTVLSALAILASAQAQQQNVLGDWFSKLSSYLPSQAVAGAGQAAASAGAASNNVKALTLENWRQVLGPKPDDGEVEPEPWWVFVTGGNKTCYGLCGKANQAWEQATGLLSFSPSAPNLAILDCEANRVLCNAWVAGPPAIWHITVPPTEGAPTDIRITRLNSSTITANNIVELHATESWKERKLYQGAVHPFDGPLAKTGLMIPMGYILWAFSIFPSWALMLAISLGSRTFMYPGDGPLEALKLPVALPQQLLQDRQAAID
ncbi:MAG: hypothetical protein M1817_002638 [Caeruleum heppii]|nr:MAG: hypothetical protein M1817_002638 [Caeruleum heppii]